MDIFLTLIGLTLFAGLAMPLGALIARQEKIQSDWLQQEFRHGVMAFGGGALLAALALVLVPEGMAGFSALTSAVIFLCGGLAFMLLDITLDKQDTPASQLAAMMCDFIPESMVLGAALAMGGEHVLFLAGVIALQNLPEGFNAYRELNSSSMASMKIIGLFVLMALLGPVAGICGYYFLQGNPEWLHAIMLLASGGILYSVFQDIAPQAKLERHWGPPMGAVMGFGLGMVLAAW